MRHRGSLPLVLLVVVSALFLNGCAEEDICWANGGEWLYTATYSTGGCVMPAKSAAASLGDLLFVNASAHVAGAQGTNWRSDLEIHNLSDELAVFRIDLLEHGADNSAPQSTELSVAAGQSLRLGDVLDVEFSTDGIAAMVLVPSSGRIIVTSRTYNLLGASNAFGLPAGATFGQYIPALPVDEVIRHGEQGRLIQLSHSTATDGGARANLGLVNVTGIELRVKAEFFTADGTRLGAVTRTLMPYEYEQVNRVFERVTGGDVDDGYAVLTTSTTGGAFFAYASVVDNLTGDPVAISAARLPEETPAGTGDPIYVVAAAHSTGAGGTNWRTDLQVHCWGDEAADYTIERLRHGADNSNPRSESFTLEPGRSMRFGDVLETVFSSTGASALRVTPTSGRILVTSRTYNLLDKGNDLGLPAGATFGQYIPGVTAEKAIARGEHGRLIQLSHSTNENSGFRTNLVLVNATGMGIDVEIDLYRAGGAHLGTIDQPLQPYEYRQLNRLFASVTGGDVADGYAVVRTTTEGGAFFALASVVDNLTGDPVGMGAPVILSPGSEEVLGEVEGITQILGQTSLETFVDRAQTLDVGGLLDVLVAAQSDVASRTADGMVIDYGDGWTTPDGSVREGAINIDTSGLSVTSTGIDGAMTITNDGLLVDGEPPVVGSTQWSFGLTERANGSVVGEITVGPTDDLKSSGALSGTIGIDTEICLEYPISGSLTTVVGNEVITITFGPDCDGGIDHDIEPSEVFSYTYGDPDTAASQAYIASTTNTEIHRESIVNYWRAIVGGEELFDADPGLVTYHFPFDSPVASGRLMMSIATFRFSWGWGHAFIYGSTDGVVWELLSELPPPAGNNAGHGGAVINGDLPAMFIGATDIWLEARLYPLGPGAQNGGGYCVTAQHSRWDANANANTFELEVVLE